MRYNNLQAEMARKGIRVIDIAATIGKTEKTARAKINGETDFTVTEAILIQRAYFGDQSYDYLFGH